MTRKNGGDGGGDDGDFSQKTKKRRNACLFYLVTSFSASCVTSFVTGVAREECKK